MLPWVPIARPDIGELERENVQKCITSGWISQGEFVDRAQRRLCRITGRRYAICTSSGTTSLIAALLAAKVLHPSNSFPKFVEVPTLTFAAVHNAVRLTGFEPLFLPTDISTWQVEKESWGNSFTEVVLTAPCYGKIQSSDGIDAGDKPNVKFIIEDAAESFGGSLNGKPAGKFGSVSCISFYANKICTAGEGGALLTDDYETYELLKEIVNHGISGKDYIPVTLGMNGRMTDLQAAVLCAQLERMDEMISRRESIYKSYRSAAGEDWTFPKLADGERCAPWLFAGIFEGNLHDLKDRCFKANIETRPFFPIPKSAIPHGATEYLSDHGICLPLSSTFSDEEVTRVCEVIHGG